MRERIENPSLFDSMKSPIWWIPIVLVVVGIIAMSGYKYSRYKHSSNFTFRGYVSGEGGGTLSKTGQIMDTVGGSRRSRRGRGLRARAQFVVGAGGLLVSIFGDPVSGTVYVEDETNPDNLIAWPVPERALEYFRWNDYLIKEKGKPPAIFRDGKQVTYSDFYLKEDVHADPDLDRAVADSGEQVEPDTSSTEPGGYDPADPFASAPPVAPPAPEVSEEMVSALLTDAMTLWENGQQHEAVTCCEKALAIRRQLYAANHPLVVELVGRVDSARAMLSQSDM